MSNIYKHIFERVKTANYKGIAASTAGAYLAQILIAQQYAQIHIQ